MKKLQALTVLFFLGALLLTSGCATLADAQAAKGSGESRTYAQPMDKVWDTTLAVVKESGLDLVSTNKDEGSILAQRGMTAFSYGENVAIFVEPVSGGEVKTRVEVVNKRALAANITAARWASRIFKALDERLGQGMAEAP